MNIESVKPLIEEHLREKLEGDEHVIVDIDPTTLITSNRLDLVIKIFFLTTQQSGFGLGRDIYKEHIYLFSQGMNAEPGAPEKDSIEKYFQVFSKLYEEIKEKGFNDSISLIPISNDKKLLNGAHRVSASFCLKKVVKGVVVPVPDPCYDYQYFLDLGMSRKHIELIAREFILLTENSYIALVWPSAVGHANKLKEKIHNVIYEKEVFLNHNGAHNLLAQVYAGANWLGKRSKNYEGIKNKREECFNQQGPLRVFAFQAGSLNQVVNLKEDIRRVFDIGNSSIHITDTKEEALILAEVLFNDNSIHFLNNAKPNRFVSTHEKIREVKQLIKTNNISKESILIDSGMVLSAYGIREAADVDVLYSGESMQGVLGVDCHDGELIHHGVEKQSLIYDPEFFFYYEGLKFVSFKQLGRMKGNRKQQKDLDDLNMMKSVVEHKSVIRFYRGIYASYLYHKSRVRIMFKSSLKRLLINLKVFEFAKNIRNKCIGKR